jgi:hypothetical protein
MRPPREPDWRGVAAVLTILGVFAVLVIGALYAGRNPSYTISSEEIATVATVLGAAIGAVAGYMAGGRRPPRDPPAPPELRAYCAPIRFSPRGQPV